MRDAIWHAEFRGFFWGEGCLDISPFNRAGSPNTSYVPRARIGLNAVDLPVLKEIQDEFGGHLHYRKPTNAWAWQLTGKEKLLHMVRSLQDGRMAAAKSAQLDTFMLALSLIPVRGKAYTPELRSELLRCKRELERMKHQIAV